VAHDFARIALRPQELRFVPLLALPFAVALVLRGVAALRTGRRDALTLEAGLACTLALLVATYFGVYLTTPIDLDWHLATSLVRLCAQLWPGLVVLALGLAGRGLDRARPRAVLSSGNRKTSDTLRDRDRERRLGRKSAAAVGVTHA